MPKANSQALVSMLICKKKKANILPEGTEKSLKTAYQCCGNPSHNFKGICTHGCGEKNCEHLFPEMDIKAISLFFFYLKTFCAICL